MTEVVGIRFKKAGKMYYFDPAGLKLEKEDGAIVETARGIEYGVVIKGNTFVADETIVPPLKQVIRKATEEDKKMRCNLKRLLCQSKLRILESL